MRWDILAHLCTWSIGVLCGYFLGVWLQSFATARALAVAEERKRALDAYCGTDLSAELKRAEPALRAMVNPTPNRATPGRI